MNPLAVLWRNAIWLAPIVFVAGIALLVSAVRGLVRANQNRQILSVPVLREQQVQFTGAGPVNLAVEGPLFTTRFAGTSFTLVALATGEVVPSWPIIFRTRTSGFTSVRVEVRTFRIPRPGAYRFRIDGLKDGASAPDGRILFARPFGVPLALHILGIIFSAMLAIGSGVAFSLRMAGR